MFVGCPFVPLLVALAIETAGCIFALLAANLRSFDTLVDIGACFSIGQKLVARIAFAVIARWCIDASMTALIELNAKTLVDVAMRWLVTLVRTIWLLIAHELLIDTRTIGALKFVRIRARIVLCFTRTVEFIRSITTIVLTVATKLFSYALEILTREFLCGARFVLCIALLSLVTAVAAIVVVIAYPIFI